MNEDDELTSAQMEAENRKRRREYEAGERVRARGRDQKITEEAARLNPMAAELVTGYQQRVQGLDRKGVRKAELDQMYAHMDKKGRWSTETTRKGNTALVWNGVDAGGNRRRMVLQTAQGTGHSVADFREHPEKLNFVMNHLTENFGNAYAFVMNKPSGYQMTDQERIAKQKIDQTTKDLKTSGWAPAGGWSGELKPQQYSGPKYTADKVKVAKEREDAKARDAEGKKMSGLREKLATGTGWDTSTAKGELMTRLGIDKQKWDEASRDEKKRMLASGIYRDKGYASDEAKAGMSAVADYYDRRKEEEDRKWSTVWKQTSGRIGRGEVAAPRYYNGDDGGREARVTFGEGARTVGEVTDKRMSDLGSILGKDFMKEIGSRGRKALRSTVESRVGREADANDGYEVAQLGKMRDMESRRDRWRQGARRYGGTTWETYRRYYGLG